MTSRPRHPGCIRLLAALRKTLVATLVATLPAALASAGATGCIAQVDCGPDRAIVTRVIDGDTVELNDGTRVRLLGIDAPETGTCWASEARAAATSLLIDRVVDLEYLDRCTDDYDRVLAHVVVDGESVSVTLARLGAVCAWNLEGNDWRADRIRTAARSAASGGAGFWGECPEVPCRSK